MEEDAEIALLHSMQQNALWDGIGDGGDEADGAGEEDVPTNSDQEEMKEPNVAEPVLRAESPDGDSYDPLLPSSIPANVLGIHLSQPDSRSSSRASTRKPKTIGGFLAEDSDDEDAPQISISKGLQVPVDAPTRSVSRSPLHLSATPQDTPTPEIIGMPSATDSIVASGHDANQASLTEEIPNADSDYIPPPAQAPSATAYSSSSAAGPAANIPKARLPHDRVGILEDRITEDPRGDLEAWLSLISEHRKRNKLDDARAVYERFFKVFPSAADIWVAYAEMELDNDNFYGAENIFSKSLLIVPNVNLWSVYLNYIRRRNDLTNDVTGTARATISQAYEFVLDNIGIDRESGRIWQDFVQFIRSAPGQIGGSSWQDQQKMDQMRKAFQRAVTIPHLNVNALWKEYDLFEMSLNKLTGRKFLQERSPAYMTARSANTALENITRGLVRSNLPRLPPALGFQGDQEFIEQVELWHRWINWELEDPLVLKDDDLESYRKRILYVYKQAVMALRFWPEIWVEAAEWCFASNLEKDGNEFLERGTSASPESCLLAFKQADRLEIILPIDEGEEGLASRGKAVREPYNKLHNALYDLLKKLKARETRELARIEDSAVLDAHISAVIEKIEEDDDDMERSDKAERQASQANLIKAVQQGYAMQTQMLSRTISFSWIALMRAMRRVQGKGKVGTLIGGSRQILNDARLKGRITSDVYIASALIEHNVYKDPAGTKIFERGAKLFPEDEGFILEYLKHLLNIGDTTNARAVFETSVNRLTQKPELILKAKPLYVFFHRYESEYGELSQIRKLERRIADLFPEDPKLQRFASRYSVDGFDPTAVRPIISPATQMRPKQIMQSIEKPGSVQDSPRPQYRQTASPRPQYKPENSPRPMYLQANNSPKRPFNGEDSDNDANRPRKLARGESPLKGAAGRRLDQQKRLQQQTQVTAWQANTPAFVVPRDITFLLSIIPRAETYTASRFNPEAMVRLLGQTHIPDYSIWKASTRYSYGR